MRPGLAPPVLGDLLRHPHAGTKSRSHEGGFTRRTPDTFTVSQYRHAYHKLSPLAANRHAGTLVQVDGKRPTRLVTEPSSRLRHASASLSEPPFSCYRAVPLRPEIQCTWPWWATRV